MIRPFGCLLAVSAMLVPLSSCAAQGRAKGISPFGHEGRPREAREAGAPHGAENLIGRIQGLLPRGRFGIAVEARLDEVFLLPRLGLRLADPGTSGAVRCDGRSLAWAEGRFELRRWGSPGQAGFVLFDGTKGSWCFVHRGRGADATFHDDAFGSLHGGEFLVLRSDADHRTVRCSTADGRPVLALRAGPSFHAYRLGPMGLERLPLPWEELAAKADELRAARPQALGDGGNRCRIETLSAGREGTELVLRWAGGAGGTPVLEARFREKDGRVLDFGARWVDPPSEKD